MEWNKLDLEVTHLLQHVHFIFLIAVLPLPIPHKQWDGWTRLLTADWQKSADVFVCLRARRRHSAPIWCQPASHWNILEEWRDVFLYLNYQVIKILLAPKKLEEICWNEVEWTSYCQPHSSFICQYISVQRHCRQLQTQRPKVIESEWVKTVIYLRICLRSPTQS